jgi:hypothetical protein
MVLERFIGTQWSHTQRGIAVMHNATHDDRFQRLPLMDMASRDHPVEVLLDDEVFTDSPASSPPDDDILNLLSSQDTAAR